MADKQGRGGARPSRGGANAGKREEGAKKREAILDLSKYLNLKMRVKLLGGRECMGVLKGYDQLLNMVLDDTVEFLRDPTDTSIMTEETRKLGRLVCRGTAVVMVAPEDGSAQIPNPFMQES